eukprot:CAMPEP_0117535556 /NCGR_PEP_ID=MMETSP0784-20121206/40995_1 /TAXON_ID=39447 /ORGANISM="" /LENGTH=56 /DNA_ID=CAMNT_0005332085 /DNA_START=866 /DNA_END=1032 /DNA_ORIENTATION=-
MSRKKKRSIKRVSEEQHVQPRLEEGRRERGHRSGVQQRDEVQHVPLAEATMVALDD